MLSFMKGMFKLAGIGTAAVAVLAGGTALVAGPGTLRAVFHDIEHKAHSTLDALHENPATLRKELIQLGQEYPQRIQAATRDLAELREQERALLRDRDISNKVVELAQADRDELAPKLEAAAIRAQESGGHRLAAIATDEAVMSFNAASEKVRQLNQLIHAHQSRASDCEHDLVYLQEQSQRFEELLAKLETEHTQYQTQLQQLDRQVDAIERNKRLIGMLERRERTMEEISTFDTSTLQQLAGKLSMLRSEQEAQLDLLTAGDRAVDYEELARVQLSGQCAESLTFEDEARGQLSRVER